MPVNCSIEFFDRQFEQQARDREFRLNPFEEMALPFLRGRVLDLGCGMGNLTIEAARRGCSVVALDSSAAAIQRICQVASEEKLSIQACRTDLKRYDISGDFDVVVSIGLLMFFDCPRAYHMLGDIQNHVAEGGHAIVNVLTEGTTYLDMFDAENHCLFARGALESRFHDWQVLVSEYRDFDAPGPSKKTFSTVIARKPGVPASIHAAHS
jgi:tellurite methyltransferase